ncbi:hypothetical protein JW906_12820 [bacterium]|nr:hypothetical protein [bacterium]
MKILAILLMLSQAAFAQEEMREAKPVPEQDRQRLSSLTAGLPELGAEPSGQPVFFSDNLWEYINGGAEAYHQYDFFALFHQVFLAGDAEVTVDIYDMGSLENAFGIYSSERSPDYRFLPVGSQGFGDAYALNFFRNRYYVKLSLYQDKPDSSVLLRFGEKISDRIPGAKGIPECFSVFPAENAIAHSETFILKTPLGHGYLGPAYAMSYFAGDGTDKLLVSVAESPAQASERAQKLRTHFQESGSCEVLPGLGAGAFRGSNPYEGTVLCLPEGRWLVLHTGEKGGGEELVRKLAERLKEKGI